MICHGDYTIQGGVQAVEALVRENPDMTAVFVTNYEMTMGAVIGLNEMGVSMPDDISLVGFDNLSFARACRPALTIVSQPTEKIARETAQIMLARLEGQERASRSKLSGKLQTDIFMGKSIRRQGMSKNYLLGIDIGTSACKVAVFDRNGQVMASATGDYPVYYPQEGWAQQNPEEWWDAVCGAIQEMLEYRKHRSGADCRSGNRRAELVCHCH